MKVTVQLGKEGKRLRAKVPYDGCAHVVVSGVEECPGCKQKGEFKVQGSGMHIESHDTYAADAVTLCCGGWCGTIRVTMNTLFGIEEDERVLKGRCRVY